MPSPRRRQGTLPVLSAQAAKRLDEVYERARRGDRRAQRVAAKVRAASTRDPRAARAARYLKDVHEAEKDRVGRGIWEGLRVRRPEAVDALHRTIAAARRGDRTAKGILAVVRSCYDAYKARGGPLVSGGAYHPYGLPAGHRPGVEFGAMTDMKSTGPMPGVTWSQVMGEMQRVSNMVPSWVSADDLARWASARNIKQVGDVVEPLLKANPNFKKTLEDAAASLPDSVKDQMWQGFSSQDFNLPASKYALFVSKDKYDADAGVTIAKLKVKSIEQKYKNAMKQWADMLAKSSGGTLMGVPPDLNGLKSQLDAANKLLTAAVNAAQSGASDVVSQAINSIMDVQNKAASEAQKIASKAQDLVHQAEAKAAQLAQEAMQRLQQAGQQAMQQAQQAVNQGLGAAQDAADRAKQAAQSAIPHGSVSF